jgi:hypothetical protein
MYSGNIFPSDPDLRAVPMHFRSFGELSNLIGELASSQGGQQLDQYTLISIQRRVRTQVRELSKPKTDLLIFQRYYYLIDLIYYFDRTIHDGSFLFFYMIWLGGTLSLCCLLH